MWMCIYQEATNLIRGNPCWKITTARTSFEFYIPTVGKEKQLQMLPCFSWIYELQSTERINYQALESKCCALLTFDVIIALELVAGVSLDLLADVRENLQVKIVITTTIHITSIYVYCVVCYHWTALTYGSIALKPPFFFPLTYLVCLMGSRIGLHMKPAVYSRRKQNHPIFFLQTWKL